VDTEVALVFQELDALQAIGTDAALILEELLSLVQRLLRLKVLTIELNDLSPVEREIIPDLVRDVPLPSLHQLWQIMARGYEELARAPNAFEALNVIAVRVLYSARLPDVTALVAKLDTTPPVASVSADLALADDLKKKTLSA
jgi:DNA polymerase-3 subunit gamma/tau